MESGERAFSFLERALFYTRHWEERGKGMEADTISAIATAQGAGGIGIVRISGARALAVADAIFRPLSGCSLMDAESHHAIYGRVEGANGRTIDEALALVMRAPHSYTREDVVELQCHGGAAILRRVLARTWEQGARPAERGEFTKRAFLNGRLDLAQAEAVMAVIEARSDRALAMAEGHLAGHFSTRIRDMRQTLLSMTAHIEAAIDFPEDEVDDVLEADLERNVVDLINHILDLLATANTGRILREGLMTAIVGKPNVGKSSLLNALLREERAIVTDIPGTTRDAIEEYADIGGVPLRIIDTAGIREAANRVEQIGVERARAYVSEAALVLALFDSSRALTEEDEAIFSLLAGKETIFLLTKSDLPAVTDREALLAKARACGVQGEIEIVAIAAQRDAQGADSSGLAALAAAIARRAYRGAAEGEEAGFVADARQADVLRCAKEHLQGALLTLEQGTGLDFVSIDLRAAWEKLGELTGETIGTDILDEIFSKFCIGK